jgi:hypothetical protein
VNVRRDPVSLREDPLELDVQIGEGVGELAQACLQARQPVGDGGEATTRYLADHPSAPHLIQHAAIHGYTTVCCTGFFVTGAVTCGILHRPGPPTPPAQELP